jgi:peptidoglycan/LPS O-acetylase OafA/YrhL
MVNDKPQKFYLPGLDIVRCLGFFTVFIIHAFRAKFVDYQALPAPFAELIPAVLDAGKYSIDMFFVSSSYLITELLLREHDATGSVDAKAFYLRRMLRIFPLYYVFVIFAIFIYPLFVADAAVSYRHSLGLLTYTFNWVVSFWGNPARSFFSHLWSVSVEEQFYLAYPFIVRLIGVKNLKAVAVTALCIATISRLVIIKTDLFVGAEQAMWVSTLTRLDPLAAGILLAVFLREKKITLLTGGFHKLAVILLSITTLAVLSTYFSVESNIYYALLIYPAAALASVMIIWAASSTNSDFSKFSVLIYLGKISYGLYIFHLAGLAIARNLLGSTLKNNSSAVSVALLGFVLTCILGMTSYHLLEKPFLKLKKKFTYVPSRPV